MLHFTWSPESNTDNRKAASNKTWHTHVVSDCAHYSAPGMSVSQRAVRHLLTQIDEISGLNYMFMSPARSLNHPNV